MAGVLGSQPRLLVLYGSQTGSAEEVAFQLARDAARRGFRESVQALDKYDRAELVNESLVVFVVATTGDGDPPDNMKQFWRFLLRKGLPQGILSDLGFVVFGLGDSSYAKYNFVAKKLRNRLVQLGAREVAGKGFGDDQSAFGLEGDLDKWTAETLWPALLAMHPLPEGFEIDYSPQLFEPTHKALQQVAGTGTTLDLLEEKAKVLENIGRPFGCYETPALRGKLVVNKRITKVDWEQDVRHVEFEFQPGSCPPYVAGDIAILHPENVLDDTTLECLCRVTGVESPETMIQGLKLPGLPESLSFQTLVTMYLDVLGTPRRRFFEALYFFASGEEEKEKLEEMCSAEGNDLFHAYCKKERKTYVDVLTQDFKTCVVPLHYFVDMVPLLEPREYSIASSRAVHGADALHLTIAILSFLTPWARRKTGVASQWISTRQPGTRALLFVKRGVLRAAENKETPMVLIGPGTGVAPMRSIIYERQSATTRLYFGCRSNDNDYYYKEEWEGLAAKGELAPVRVAFSRDQTRKIYVQHLIKEDAALMYKLLIEEQGYCYISGSAKRMPTEVRETLITAIAANDAVADEKGAEALIRQMELKGRFKIESWS